MICFGFIYSRGHKSCQYLKNGFYQNHFAMTRNHGDLHMFDISWRRKVSITLGSVEVEFYHS